MYRVPQNRRRPETPQQRRARNAQESADLDRRLRAQEAERLAAAIREQREAEERYRSMSPAERATVDAADARDEARHLAAVKVREEHSEWLARRDAERYGPHGTYGT
jgi:hypothetical protein